MVWSGGKWVTVIAIMGSFGFFRFISHLCTLLINLIENAAMFSNMAENTYFQ